MEWSHNAVICCNYVLWVIGNKIAITAFIEKESIMMQLHSYIHNPDSIYDYIVWACNKLESK